MSEAASSSRLVRRLLLERELAGFVFAHLGAFGEQTLKLVGGELFAQESMQTVAEPRRQTTACRRLCGVRRVGITRQTRGVRQPARVRDPQRQVVEEDPSAAVFSHQRKALPQYGKRLSQFSAFGQHATELRQCVSQQSPCAHRRSPRKRCQLAKRG